MPEAEPHILTSIYQFGNFITGPSNRMAFAAARRVAEQPGRLYNPLVVYGGVGLGKTHLLQALGNEVSAAHPDWSVVMLSGGQIRRQDLDGAERADLLLIDDLHLCIRDRDIQIRMIPLFDAMVGTGRQIAASTDTVPQKIEELDPKLLSRLLGGVIVGLKEIDVNEKAMILASKAGARGVELPEEVLLTIASRVPANVREMEGSLNRVLLYASLFDGQITRTIVDEALPPTTGPQPVPVPPDLEEASPPGQAEAPSGEYGDFITGLDTKVTDLLTQEQNDEKLRQEYKEKLYIWRMKGFNTARVERTLDQDIDAATREYQAFTDSIERLISLQEEFGNMAAAATPEMIARVEALLFDPDKTDELALAVQSMKKELVPKLTPQPVPLSPISTSRSAGPAEAEEKTAPLSTTAAPSEPAPPPALPAAPSAKPPPEPRPTPQAPPVPQPAVLLEMPARAALAEASAEPGAETSPSNLGLIEENWPRIDDRLMEDF